MAQNVKPIPEGYRSITPYLTIKDADKAIEFYKKAFGAVELNRLNMLDGRVGHAEIKIGDSILMITDECKDSGMKGPLALGGSSVFLHFYTEDVDTMFAQALAAGATVKVPLETHFYGDRLGGLVDPFGHLWYVSTHVEDVSPEEIKRRADVFSKEMAAKE